MATHVATVVRAKTSSLSEMAKMLSTCTATKPQAGDTGWLTVHYNHMNKDGDAMLPSLSPTVPSSLVQSEEDPHPISEELLQLLLEGRPGALQKAQMSYGWEVFIVTDVRQSFTPTAIGALRKPGFAISGNMRRNSKRKPVITPKSYYIETFGCQMNASDSERMAACLDDAGYSITQDPRASALYIVNTCALRDHAQAKVYSHLGPHAQRKWDAPDEVTLIVTGCVAQQEGSRLLTQVPELDIVMGPQYANRIDEVLQEFQQQAAQIVAVEPAHIHEDISKPKRTSRTTAWVNIIYGCLEKCAYCVVPNTRGLEQSRPMDAIRDEVQMLAQNGYKEVILLGQNVDAYGRDLFPKQTLSDLFRHIHDVDGLERIRFTTGHPRYISANLINTVYELPKVMEHFHVPPQSGDSGVLKEMGRGYTRERYIEIARSVREKMPDASICADMIVGFPGESEEAFENSVTLADEVVFDANMVRSYSARPNTQAALRPDQVPEGVKKVRLDIMNEKMKAQALQRSQRYVQRVVEVLVEDVNRKVDGEMMGRERTNRVVFFKGDQDLVGCIVYVLVEEAFAFSLRGRVVEDSD